MILAASNRPDIIDPALLRSGRFDRLVYIPEPSLSDREEILAVHMRNMPVEGSLFDDAVRILAGFDLVSLDTLAEKFAGNAVTFAKLKTAARKFPQTDHPVSLPEQRWRLAAAFAAHNVRFSDPKKTDLIAGIARETEGYVGSDLEGLCREAAMHALRESRAVVTREDFMLAGQKVHATMNDRVRGYYEGISTRFKAGLPKKAQNLVEYQ
jgi:transitional endoplasmic reticulum ATPase